MTPSKPHLQHVSGERAMIPLPTHEEETYMNHDGIQLNVNMPSQRANGTRRLLADIKKKTLRSRILSALLGEQHEVVIIMPSRNVTNVTFTRAVDEYLEGGAK